MTDVMLVLNAGSSSVKAAAYSFAAPAILLWKGSISGIGGAPLYEARLGSAAGETVALDAEGMPQTHGPLIRWMLKRLRHEMPSLNVVAAGHRVVHGGRYYDAPIQIDDNVLETLHSLSELAPGHQPHNLSGIHAIRDTWPQIPQVACFDTAFHRSQPKVAQTFALPRRFAEQGMVRYGFHGLSYEYIASVLPRHAGPKANGRFIVAHLGHGASLCAIEKGHSVATTMGFTVLDGLMMGKRCGSIDPGLILHLIRHQGMNAQEVELMLRRESGLLGVSGISDDMRDLMASDDPHAREAIDLFVHSIVSNAGSLIAQMGGLDGFVFTAGIGEHSSLVRKEVVKKLGWLGMRLDSVANEADAVRISTDDSDLPVFVIPTDEEGIIAEHTRLLTQRAAAAAL